LRILQQLQHPNIVNFKFCLIRRAKIYIVMEYIRGGTLRQIMAQHQPSFDDLKIWFAQLVSALGYLHEHGIMHRDVKPSNCMIDTFGKLKLTDFGLALQEEDINGTSAPVKNENDTLDNEIECASSNTKVCIDEHSPLVLSNLISSLLGIGFRNCYQTLVTKYLPCARESRYHQLQGQGEHPRHRQSQISTQSECLSSSTSVHSLEC
jgi:serine/threonine protein kinase